MTFPMATSTASTAAAASLRLLPAPATPSSRTIRFPPIRRRAPHALLSVSALSKLSEASPVPISQEPTQTLPDEDAPPPRPGVYGVFDPAGDLQFLGISRNVRASIEGHRRKVHADLCASVKRKRASNGPVIAAPEKEALAAGCRKELAGLLEYFKEVSGHKMQIDGGGNLSTNAMIGCLLEESNLGLSKLVDETFEKLKGTEGVSVASVRSSVLLIGQRMMYGQSSPDADVLEDESDLSLWCWEKQYAYVDSLKLACNGKEVWVFDIDETTLSNLPYYAKHGFGYIRLSRDLHSSDRH